MPDETFNLPDDGEFEQAMQDNTAETRTNPLYDRQASLGLTTSAPIWIVGCGGVGCWVSLSLALAGVEDLTLWDGDTISIHNLNRFPLPESNVGELKSVALSNWLNTLRPRANAIVARGEFDPTLHSGGWAAWLICATDSLKSRKMCYEYAQANGISYLEVGADGERWSISPKPPEFSTELEDAPGYQTVPVHVGPCMMAGAAVAYYILHNQVPMVSHLVTWDKGPVYRDRTSEAELDFETLDEVPRPKSHYGWVKCPLPTCNRDVEREPITFIRHLRECYPNLGLVEARDRQREIFDATNPANTQEPTFAHVTEVAHIDPAVMEDVQELIMRAQNFTTTATTTANNVLNLGRPENERE